MTPINTNMKQPDIQKKKPGLVKKFAKLILWILAIWIIAWLSLRPFWGTYKIPNSGSGGIYPTLKSGDFFLVKKNYKNPQRGDMVVFQYNDDLASGKVSVARIVGVGGDIVEYVNKQLRINNINLPQIDEGEFHYVDNNLNFVTSRHYIEEIGGRKHSILLISDKPGLQVSQIGNFAGRDNCWFDSNTMFCKIPVGQYFMLGDNRDNSSDSRYRGFVPENQILGKITSVWMNFQDSRRIGLSID